MTAVAKLLAQKQQLIERLQKNSSAHEREEIERLLEQIDTALDLLEDAGSSDPE
jgi:predicted amino acid dehydrogenase